MGNISIKSKEFHTVKDIQIPYVELYTSKNLEDAGVLDQFIEEYKLSYRFHLHQHPYIQELVSRLVRDGIVGLQDADTDYVMENGKGKPKPSLYEEFFNLYKPGKLVPNSKDSPYPVRELDFSQNGAYAIYNWELFYHIPFIIAVHLSKNQRFAEAQRWFHFLFDPTDDSDSSKPEGFWKVRPFQYTDVAKIDELLLNLISGEDKDAYDETLRSIEKWKSAPFRPHVIARYRQQAYMYKTIMAYLDNLIDWGDSLFRQDTGEAIDEALQMYVMAANLLGPRPQIVPKKGEVRTKTYANMRNELKAFGSASSDIESLIPFDLAPFPAESSGNKDCLKTLHSIGQLHFCIPPNDKLLGYWDKVANRLFKIRNSLSFHGVFRQLALFEPPIDPAMLASAVAAGLDVGAIVNGLNQPLPLVRFQFLVQKASEIIQEVKSLGNNLLSAMEKEDNEALTILRAKHERVVMEMVEQVRYGQLQEAIKSSEGLLQSLALAVQRYSYYELQLGRKADEIERAIPELGELDQESLHKMKFTMDEPVLIPRDIEVDIAEDLGESGGKIINNYEKQEINLSNDASTWQNRASWLSIGASSSYYIPLFKTTVSPLGMGFDVAFGGPHIGPAGQAMAEWARNRSTKYSNDSLLAGKTGGFQKREQDWTFQSNLAAGEITQIFKQIRASEIREAIADMELKNHRQQMKNAEEIENFLNELGTEKTGKKTNKAFYTWMKREIKGLYSQCFQFAFDIAKKAERALQQELGDTELNYVKFSYLAGKEGLLAGEKLYMDVKRMEMAYHDLNKREYELTKHVSLLQVDPLALIHLRTTGRCNVELPEALFDMDGPGHFFRRIKTVAVSVPCVTGPYTGVNLKLTLLKSRIRKSPGLLNGDYAREDAEDKRFSDYFGSVQSIVTSTAQNDSGLFETNLRDERYLPFENSGVISEWQLELPANPGKDNPAQFDYNTISDVILHISYTAREGGNLLRAKATEHLNKLIKEARAPGSVRLFSVRHEFPIEWANFLSQEPDSDQHFEISLELRPEHYPFWCQNSLDKMNHFEILARSTKLSMNIFKKSNSGKEKIGELIKDAAIGNLLHGHLATGIPAKPSGTINLFFDKKEINDLWFAVSFS